MARMLRKFVHNLSLRCYPFAAVKLQHNNDAMFAMKGAVKDYVTLVLLLKPVHNQEETYLACIICFSSKPLEHHQSLIYSLQICVLKEMSVCIFCI